MALTDKNRKKMKANLIDKDVSFNLGQLLKAGFSPIDIFVSDKVCDKIKKGDTLKAIFCSYPILKDGDFFDIECEVNFSCFLSDLVMPMALKLKEVYDNVAVTLNMETMHSLDSLWVEALIIDTDKKTITMELGS